jgi:peroxiredoxin (alkyl hydroperoxide reductase subunit C)
MSIQFFTPRGPGNEVVKIPRNMRKTVKWLPQIGDIFPNFTVDTTQGRLHFWDWAEGQWTHLFSHPAAFTPVCTTEIASFANLQDEWSKHGVRNLALTGSTLEEQTRWHDDIKTMFNIEVSFPCAQDPGQKLAALFGMMHDKESTEWSIRKSFLIDPSMKVRMVFEYPIFVGRSGEEILRTLQALQLRDKTGGATPADWLQGEMQIIPDDRPETAVLRDFGTPSTYLSHYLRVAG